MCRITFLLTGRCSRQEEVTMTIPKMSERSQGNPEELRGRREERGREMEEEREGEHRLFFLIRCLLLSWSFVRLSQPFLKPNSE